MLKPESFVNDDHRAKATVQKEFKSLLYPYKTLLNRDYFKKSNAVALQPSTQQFIQ